MTSFESGKRINYPVTMLVIHFGQLLTWNCTAAIIQCQGQVLEMPLGKVSARRGRPLVEKALTGLAPDPIRPRFLTGRLERKGGARKRRSMKKSRMNPIPNL